METDVTPATPADGPTPYIAIPFMVLALLFFVGLMIMTICVLFDIAGWFPSAMTFEGERYYGGEVLTHVVMRSVTRVLLVVWPILSIAMIVGENQERKRRAAAA